MSWMPPVDELVLGLMLALVLAMVWQVQKRVDFDFAQALKDGDRVSISRVAAMGAFITSTYCVMHAFVTVAPDRSNILDAYLVCWGGVKVGEKLADALKRSDNSGYT